MVKTRKFVVKKPFEGVPKASDFELVTEELPPLKSGQVLTEALFFSVDPYQRVLGATKLKSGDTMIGSQVGRIVESRAVDFPVGGYLVGYWGWATHCVVSVPDDGSGFEPPRLVKPLPDGLPLSLYIGILGMPGVTAYSGLFEVCSPKPGDVIFVSGAAGAVGSTVAQLAKVHGCKVIGCAGSDDKVNWLKDELGVDVVYNYKVKSTEDILDEVVPNGVDWYFDNVGGPISSSVISRMKKKSRAAVCGSISSYNEVVLAPTVQKYLVFKEISLIGFTVHSYLHIWDKAVEKILSLIKERKLKCRETVTEGFENMPQAFIGLFKGDNTGKAIVKV